MQNYQSKLYLLNFQPMVLWYALISETLLQFFFNNMNPFSKLLNAVLYTNLCISQKFFNPSIIVKTSPVGEMA